MSDGDRKVVVCIDEIAWEKMRAYCRAAKPYEIIGMAHCKMVNGDIVVYDPFIIKQKVASATCEFDSKEFAQFLGTHDRINEVLCVWHSHVEMSAFFSSCDRGTSTALAGIGRMMRGSSSWFVSIVMNCRDEYQCKVDITSPVVMEIDATLKKVQYTKLPATEVSEEQMKNLVSEREIKEFILEYVSRKSRASFLQSITSTIEAEVKEKCISNDHGSRLFDCDDHFGFHDFRNNDNIRRSSYRNVYRVDDLIEEIVKDISERATEIKE